MPPVQQLSPPEPPTSSRSWLPNFVRRRWPWIGFAVVALVLVLFISAPTSKDGSTYWRSPTGYSEWYSYMQSQKIPVYRWRKNYDQLTGKGQTLIRIWGGSTDELYPDDQLRDWVKQGNTLISLGWWGEVTAATFSSRLETSVGPILVETTRRENLSSDEKSLLKDPQGSVVWQESLGNGQLIYITYPWLAANGHSGEGNNYAYLAKLAQQQKDTIWTDEWLHGYRDASNTANNSQTESVFDYLGRTPVAALTAQVGLMLLLLIWGNNCRFGSILRPKSPQPANSERYIQALAGVLNNAHHTDFVVEKLGAQFRQQLAMELGITSEGFRPVQGVHPPETTPENEQQDQQLAEQWASSSGRSAQELLNLLHQVSQKRRFSDQELLNWVNQAGMLLQAIR